jgi:maleate cis-trans isomerase
MGLGLVLRAGQRSGAEIYQLVELALQVYRGRHRQRHVAIKELRPMDTSASAVQREVFADMMMHVTGCICLHKWLMEHAAFEQ